MNKQNYIISQSQLSLSHIIFTTNWSCTEYSLKCSRETKGQIKMPCDYKLESALIWVIIKDLAEKSITQKAFHSEVTFNMDYFQQRTLGYRIIVLILSDRWKFNGPVCNINTMHTCASPNNVSPLGIKFFPSLIFLALFSMRKVVVDQTSKRFHF